MFKSQDNMGNPKINPLGFMGESKDTVMVPAHMVPSWNVYKAFQEGKQSNFLINTWGGLGDQICSEPAIRYGLKLFNRTNISLASTTPSLFNHLKFKNVYDTRKVENYPIWNDYMVFQTIVSPDHIFWHFMSHMLTHCVDFPSVCMWRLSLPIEDKEIQLPDFEITEQVKNALNQEKHVVIHAGKHWPSKTFPKQWWDRVIFEFKRAGWKPILIGHEVDENVGFVDVDSGGCVDLRNKLSIPEFVSLLKNCKFLFSNDSSPIHAAAAGDAFIGFVASVKHPDYIMHWRKGKWAYKTKNFSLDGAWNHVDHNPVQEKEIKIEELPSGLMHKLLPDPADVVAAYGAQNL